MLNHLPLKEKAFDTGNGVWHFPLLDCPPFMAPRPSVAISEGKHSQEGPVSTPITTNADDLQEALYTLWPVVLQKEGSELERSGTKGEQRTVLTCNLYGLLPICNALLFDSSY